MADTLVFKRQFAGHPAHCELHHEEKILRIIVRDLKLVGKKELKECLKAIKEHIEHKLPESLSTVLVIDAREGANPDLIKHTQPLLKFKNKVRTHTRKKVLFTLLVAPDKPTVGAFKTLTMGESSRPIYITQQSIPWEDDEDMTPELYHATKEAKRAERKGRK